MNFEQLLSKIKTLDELLDLAACWRSDSEKIVFTNGCFDLLHPGHVQYLSMARDRGDRLIVGVNSDASVRRLKGEHRPIQDERSRTVLLAALSMVDAVVVFDEDTPLELILALRPEVLVKGGDWAPSRIVGAEQVAAYGGSVFSLPYLEGNSTTDIERKILDRKP
jgi:D-beta-D-heptose 7-phosphate kinase/D-beta-D-heptose 1-phosphate adenosyltransferase